MAKVLISLPDALLHDADRLAKRQRSSRSELFREALRLVLEREGEERPSWSETLGVVRERMEGHWVGRWDSTQVIRDDRDADYGRRPRR
jgi:Arc/MetJ-type ribon-helix-helix transcriptional regulator